jgi:hypothetical protein
MTYVIIDDMAEVFQKRAKLIAKWRQLHLHVSKIVSGQQKKLVLASG